MTWTHKQFAQYEINETYFDRLVELYDPRKYTNTTYASRGFWAGSRWYGDVVMTCPARRTAHWASPHQNVFLYFFRHEYKVLPIIEKVAKAPLGVFHGSELGLVFDVPIILDAAEEQLSKAVIQFWTSFARTGRPVSEGQEWPAWSIEKDEVLALDVPMQVVNHSQIGKAEVCDFFDSIGPL